MELTRDQRIEKHMDERYAQMAARMVGKAARRLRRWNWDTGKGQGGTVAVEVRKMDPMRV